VFILEQINKSRDLEFHLREQIPDYDSGTYSNVERMFAAQLRDLDGSVANLWLADLLQIFVAKYEGIFAFGDSPQNPVGTLRFLPVLRHRLEIPGI
jgi:hypothetical protein